MKLLDRYIILRFIGTFLFILSLLMVISVVFDFSEKIDDFMRTQPTAIEVLRDYYLNFILYYANLFSPLIIFISLIYFTSQMAQRTEIVAILNGGVSFERFLRPFLIAATILALVALGLNHFIIPKANKVRLAFEEVYYKNRSQNYDKDIHLEVEPGHIAYFQSIDIVKGTGKRFSMEIWNDDKLEWKLVSKRAVQDTSNSKWTIYDYQIREVTDEGELIEQGARLDTMMGFDMKEFGRLTAFVAAMDYFELESFIDKERLKGSDDVPFYLIEKHQRTSYPVATYVLTLIGVSVSSRKRRGGIGMQIAMGFGIALLYIFAMKVATVSATNAGVDPLLAIWMPNMLFGLFAVYLYKKALK